MRRLSAEEIRRARQGQVQPGPAPRPRRQPVATSAAPAPQRQRRSLKRLAVIGVPLVLLALAAAYVVPLALRAHEAAGKIFVPPPPRIAAAATGTSTSPPVPTRNAQGTPVPPPQSYATTAPIALPSWDKKERINILLLGADSNAARRDEGEPPLSDTIIVMTIDPATKTVGMLSIPRDLYVNIPGVGMDKINAAYSNGELSNITGPGLVQATIEQNFGITIHYFVEIDLEGFQKLVDTLGGVTLDVTAPLKDDEYPGQSYNYTRILYHTGFQHMDGATALSYVRSRHDDSDFGRGARQQAFLKAFREQAVSLDLITKAPQLISNLGDTVRTDLSPTDVLKLAQLATSIPNGNIHSYNLLDATSVQYNPGQPYYLIPDWDKVHATLAQMMPGGTDAPAAAAPTVEKPDLSARVLVLNGTHVDKLAARASSKLSEIGFQSVSVAQAPDAGQHPASIIYDSSGDTPTSRLVAQTLGLPSSSIQQADAAQLGTNQIVVVLGDDAPPNVGN
ncbi:MAG TPA: LCP family protein [Thermomicrobiaceae bacterium]|nr:LCP family protein [Thermomicrobiaceae bacterium]